MSRFKECSGKVTSLAYVHCFKQQLRDTYRSVLASLFATVGDGGSRVSSDQVPEGTLAETLLEGGKVTSDPDSGASLTMPSHTRGTSGLTNSSLMAGGSGVAGG